MPNTPYIHAVHGPLLKAVAPSARTPGPNVFGDNATNKHWHETMMLDSDATAFDAKCEQLALYAGWDSAYPGNSCRKLCKYVRD